MQQPPNPYPQYPQQQWQQQNTSWGSSPQWQQSQVPPQQPQYPYYQRLEPQYAPPPEQPPAQPPKKRIIGLFFAIGCGLLVALVIILAISAGSKSTQDTAATQTAQDFNQVATAAAQDVNTPVTQPSPAVSEKAYKASAINTTVADLDKKGSSGQGDIVHFIATILDFVKDSSGNTGAANVSTDTTSSVVQVVFPENTDVTRLNENDTLEVWGIDAGVFSGTNAYGATVQEVGVQAQYMTDQTTGYQAG